MTHPMDLRELLEARDGRPTENQAARKNATYTVVTMLPKPWQPGIDCSPETGSDRSMDRGGGRRNLLMVKGLRGIIAIRRGCHGRHKNDTNERQEVAVASSATGVCRRSALAAVVGPGV